MIGRITNMTTYAYRGLIENAPRWNHIFKLCKWTSRGKGHRAILLDLVHLSKRLNRDYFGYETIQGLFPTLTVIRAWGRDAGEVVVMSSNLLPVAWQLYHLQPLGATFLYYISTCSHATSYWVARWCVETIFSWKLYFSMCYPLFFLVNQQVLRPYWLSLSFETTIFRIVLSANALDLHAVITLHRGPISSRKNTWMSS